MFFDRGNRRFGVIAFADNFDVGFVAQETQQFSARGSFVINDENAKRIREAIINLEEAAAAA